MDIVDQLVSQTEKRYPWRGEEIDTYFVMSHKKRVKLNRFTNKKLAERQETTLFLKSPGEMSGIMNLGIPSITVKMLRQKFDQQWSVRKTRATEDEHARVLRLIQPAKLTAESSLRGPTLSVESLLTLKEGDVLAFDYPIERPLDLTLNGIHKFRGEIVGNGRKRAFQVLEPVTEA